jgi:hypothetical protein
MITLLTAVLLQASASPPSTQLVVRAEQPVNAPRLGCYRIKPLGETRCPDLTVYNDQRIAPVVVSQRGEGGTSTKQDPMVELPAIATNMEPSKAGERIGLPGLQTGLGSIDLSPKLVVQPSMMSSSPGPK